ncbi:MobF family relaxase [Devosia sp.]|uniref:MobF family relaxase n=1 Tax=Devosia sp. TaxID=1871048 RepID=UPI001B26AD91|nr:MobF family relaxase [Devosia sp.]MBO9591158.1 relaxase domain-containing protein [Devosia sp.]
MVASFAVMKSSAYYTRQSQAVSYYADNESAGIWLRGHDALGVAAGDRVEAADFDRICAGLDHAGKPLIKAGAKPRMLGIDITLSPPKSFSVLYAAAPNDLRLSLAGAERSALEATIQLIEREIPLSRRGRNGERREHSNFVAAAFTHSEARPERHADGKVFADCQRHHHVCLPSIAERSDGTWGGIDSRQLRIWKKSLGAVFRLQLASALQQRGFAIEHVNDGWSWAIAGIPQTLIDYFSARRASLEEELADAGLTSGQAPALASAINATDRRAKENVSLDHLTAQWHEAIERLGYIPDQIVGAAFATGREQARAPLDLSSARPQRLAAVPAKLTEFQATFSRRELIEASANALVGTGAGLEEVLDGATDFIGGNAVLECAQTPEGAIFTTPEMLAAERALVALVTRNATTFVAAPERATTDQILAISGLNAEQEHVVREATRGARLVLVQGSAGTGKSTTLKAVANAWRSAGYEVAGASVAWRAANTLGADLGIEARAIDAWLKSIEQGNTPFVDKTCLIVEEAGLQSTLQTLKLLEAVDRTGGVVLMVGDENQLTPIGAGHAMRLIRQTIGATRIETVVRQHEAWARQAPKDFARGKAQKALDAFASHGQIAFENSPRAAVEAVADRWNKIVGTEPSKSVLVSAKTNAEVRALSASIRNRMRERGALTGPDISIEAADSSGNRHRLRLAAGDRIRFLRRDDALGVVNGSEARIVAIAEGPDGRVRIAADHNGARLNFSPDDVADANGRARLAHAYATTLFQAQGLTVDRALVLLSARFDRHDAYVASSRARESSELFVDTRTLDREIETDFISETGERLETARLNYLAQRLSRQNVKTLALDYLQKRERTKELNHEL